jgi:hypothetical protein
MKKILVLIAVFIVISVCSVYAWDPNPVYNPFEVIWNKLNNVSTSWIEGDGKVTTDKNVGIGTESPGAKLDVEISPGGGGAATIGSSKTSATGGYAVAMGHGTNASGYISTAIGYYTEASGGYSTAMGWVTTASGTASTAMGALTTANGYSTAMGYGTKASGDRSTAMGYRANATGFVSTAMGGDTLASGFYSTAMGSRTTASGMYSTAMGRETEASGFYSTAMGRGIEAAGDYSFAIALDDMNGAIVSQPNTMAIMGGDVGIGTVSPDARLDIEGGDLDMSGNEIKNVGNIFWGVLSLDTGDFKTSDGNGGNVVIPTSSGSVSCDTNNYACVKYFDSNKFAIQFKSPDMALLVSSFPGQWVCHGASAGDNEAGSQEWGYGAVSVITDSNGHCYGSGVDDCAIVYVQTDYLGSHAIYGVICHKVY